MNEPQANLRRTSNRRAYALLMVLVFNMLFLMLLGVAWRQMGASLRIAKVREEQVRRDEGVVCALARAMNMLETGRPPLIGGQTSYICYTTVNTSNGARHFLLTFTLAATGQETWTVSVVEQSSPPVGVPFKLQTF